MNQLTRFEVGRIDLPQHLRMAFMKSKSAKRRADLLNGIHPHTLIGNVTYILWPKPLLTYKILLLMLLVTPRKRNVL